MSKILLSYIFKTNLSSFRAAILANNTNKICRILDIERNYISNELDNAGNTALLLAIKYASPLTVKLLLQQGAHPDQTNFITFQTPLSLLASTTYDDDQTHLAKLALEMATILLDHDAYVDKPSSFESIDENGKEYVIKETPLMTAVRTKNLPMATLFVERQANVNYIEKQSGNRPIHFSIMNGDEAMFDLLENAGASCRTVVTNGENTLLHWFCYSKANDQNTSLLKKLINTGCDINAENDHKRTPLMLAAKLNMINTCQILVDANADIDKVDDKGFRAIDLSKIGGECFKLLQHVKQTLQNKSGSNDNCNRILWKKQIIPRCRMSMQISEPIGHFSTDKNKLKDYPPKISCRGNKLSIENHSLLNEFDLQQGNATKYKRMWEKVMQTKEKNSTINRFIFTQIK